MKNFFEFISEASIAAQQAARAGLVMDPHGSAYYRGPNGNYEFAAKNVGGRLVFYNKRQRFGQQDPRQTDKEKRLSKTTPINSPEISESELREKYIAKEIFNEGDIVESVVNGMIGKIIRRGTNHLICVTGDEEMFKTWIKDVREYCISPMTLGSELNKDDLAYDQNAFGLNFINKYRKK